MSVFDFVVDKEMRSSLESDWKELQLVLERSAWKAVHVLAGSIVEALLIDHLLSINYQQKDPLRMSLEDAIIACKADGILSEKTAELSTVIRRFRNLIHPGRAMRLAELPDMHSATVSKSLVLMITQEIAAAKRQTYGYTAEQISSKVERDDSAGSILTHLLKKTKSREIDRLLLEVLPERYRNLMSADANTAASLIMIEKTFHAAFELAPSTTKQCVAQRFVKVLHEEDGGTVDTYEKIFFRAPHLEFLVGDDARAVKQHLLAQLKANPSKDLFQVAFGIGKHLTTEEVSGFVDVVVHVALDSKKKSLHAVGERFLQNLYFTLLSEAHHVNTRLEDWVKFLRTRNRVEDAERVEALVIDDVPF